MNTRPHDPFAEHMAAVARALLGEPNALQSKPGNPRWGNKGSLAVDERKGVWFDHETGEGGGVLDLTKREKGLTGREAIEWMRSIGCHIEDRPHSKITKANGSKRPSSPDARQELIEIYDYTDETGAQILQVGRLGYRKPDDGELMLGKNGKPEKTFRQKRPDPDEPKVWIAGLGAGEYMRKGPGHDWYRFNDEKWARLPNTKQRKTVSTAARSVPYRLPELIEAISLEQTIFIVEGEQKADALAKWNLVATCNAQGAGRWTAEHAGYLRGADAVILPDNDDNGRKHADAIAQRLQDIAARIRLVELPDLEAKGDIVDWIKAGHTREELDALIDQAADWQTPQQAAPVADNSRNNLSAKELNTMTFAPIKYVVPGIIVEGLTLLAAKPKIGKSWMMLHAATAVARGGFTLGDIHCVEGDVLYCALEDNLRRLQSRMTKLFGTQDWPERLFFRCEMPRLADGGLQVIKDWIKGAN